jgi:hypothetical protein
MVTVLPFRVAVYKEWRYSGENRAPLVPQLTHQWHLGGGQKGSGSLQTSGARQGEHRMVVSGHFRLMRRIADSPALGARLSPFVPA